uniref:GIY-YIG domain-containing protein n=1 Tax=Panagrellus redivivus TaxID=6233 RepID=A0A7E4UVY6_PANRE
MRAAVSGLRKLTLTNFSPFRRLTVVRSPPLKSIVKPGDEQKSGIYAIHCFNCGSDVYIGRTKRTLITRAMEHIRWKCTTKGLLPCRKNNHFLQAYSLYETVHVELTKWAEKVLIGRNKPPANLQHKKTKVETDTRTSKRIN